MSNKLTTRFVVGEKVEGLTNVVSVPEDNLRRLKLTIGQERFRIPARQVEERNNSCTGQLAKAMTGGYEVDLRIKNCHDKDEPRTEFIKSSLRAHHRQPVDCPALFLRRVIRKRNRFDANLAQLPEHHSSELPSAVKCIRLVLAGEGAPVPGHTLARRRRRFRQQLIQLCFDAGLSHLS
jgi:hypothetical protein